MGNTANELLSKFDDKEIMQINSDELFAAFEIINYHDELKVTFNGNRWYLIRKTYETL